MIRCLVCFVVSQYNITAVYTTNEAQIYTNGYIAPSKRKRVLKEIQFVLSSYLCGDPETISLLRIIKSVISEFA